MYWLYILYGDILEHLKTQKADLCGSVLPVPGLLKNPCINYYHGSISKSRKIKNIFWHLPGTTKQGFISNLVVIYK